MDRRVVISNGKKYIVNCAGWNDDVGPSASPGTLWMRSITDDRWYSVTLTGTSASTAIYVNPTPLSWYSPGPDFGYQLLSYSGSVYQVYLSGSGASARITASTTPWPISSDYKSELFLQSTDSNFYSVYVTGSKSLFVDQNSKISL
jgi:hypothetical protein